MKRLIYLPCVLAFLLLVLAGCKKDYRQFEFNYSMESVSNYKMAFSFDSDKHFKTEVYNYYMDKMARKARPKVVTGVLTDEEYAELYALLKEADLFGMDDTYGFDDETPDEDGILTQLIFSADGETKYITIRHLRDQKFPAAFQRLMNKSVEYIR